MTFRRRLSTKQRRELYQAECEKARELGKGEHPICNLCGNPVLPGSLWDESHDGIPAAWGGEHVLIAHRRCNRMHGSQVVTPMVAKAKRVTERFLDIHRSRTPLPGGREDRLKKKIDGTVIPRERVNV